MEAVESTGYGAIPKSDPRHKTEAKYENSTTQVEYKAMKVINIVSGSLLVVIGILMVTGMLGRFLSLLG